MKDPATREISKVRLRCLDLAKSFFITEPDAEGMARWRGTFSALARERVCPRFDSSVAAIHQLLKSKNLQEIQSEYYTLFVDPFAGDQLSTAASFYLDGGNHGRTLADVCGFLGEAGFEKSRGVTESEDSLVVMLDVLARLIEEEKDGKNDNSPQLQRRLLQRYLIPFAEKLAEACAGRSSAEFYQACCAFLCGYLDLESIFTHTGS
jgi:TorA maturation chaperone TorD